MLKAYRFRIYPTKEQQITLSKFFGCSRFVSNWALETKLKHQTQDRDGISRFNLLNLLPDLKGEHEFLKECHSQVLQNSVDRVHVAFGEFLKGKRGCPNWKSKKNPVCSVSFPQSVKLEGISASRLRRIKLPKIGSVKIVLHRECAGQIKTVTVSRVASGKYFASILVEDGKELPETAEVDAQSAVGLDFGIKDLVVASDGRTWNYGENLKAAEKNVIRFQKKLSRKVKGSQNFFKAKNKLARRWEKVANIRNDVLHKISNELLGEKQPTVVVEDLAVKNMVKNRKLARVISRQGWSTLRSYLTYKAAFRGKNLLVIGRFEPSSKLCSECGVINKELKLSEREWLCGCGAKHNRDLNAAKNIRNMGLNKNASGIGVKVSGQNVSLASASNSG